MILKSMGVECKKDDMDGYAQEVDEEATGKFTFLQFCQVKLDYEREGHIIGPFPPVNPSVLDVRGFTVFISSPCMPV